MKKNFLKISAVAILLIIATISCTKDVHVTGVTLDKKEITLVAKETTTLKASIQPYNATNKMVTWTSSDAAVATVSYGAITAKGVGTVTITATTEDGSYTAQCTVKVNPGEPEKVDVTGVTLNKNEIVLSMGETTTLKASVLPFNASNKTVTWTSDNTTVAPVSNGAITAKEIGTATITVTTEEGNFTATCTVNVVFEKGVMINGIKWATRNVDIPGTFAANPEDAGMFYQWNRKVGWSSTNPLVNSNGGTTWVYSEANGNTWAKANDPCPAGWRVPTRAEQETLASANSEWTTLNGVNGRTFGSGDNTLFLPATGYRLPSTGMLYYAGTNGSYWSSTAYDATTYSYYLHFESYYVTHYDYYRSAGLSVRCVAE